MKVKDTAMGSWFKKLSRGEAVLYIYKSLCNARDGVFWDIIEFYDLSAKDPIGMSEKVFDKLMEFELDPEERTQDEDVQDTKRN